MEEKDVLQEREEQLQQEIGELEYNSPIAKKRRELVEVQSQRRKKAAQKIMKEIEKIDKKTKKASKVVEKFAKKRVDLLAEGTKWSKDKTHAFAVVQSLVAKASGLRAQLKKLEEPVAEQAKGMTRTEAYDQAVDNLRQAPADNKSMGYTEEEEESVTINLGTRKIVKR